MVVFGIFCYLAAAAVFYAYAVKTALPSSEPAPALLLVVNNEATESTRRAA